MKRLLKFFQLIWQDIHIPWDEMLCIIGVVVVVIIGSVVFMAITYGIAKLIILIAGKSSNAAYGAFLVWFSIFIVCVVIKYLWRKWGEAGKEVNKK